jgi:hypothetical protein
MSDYKLIQSCPSSKPCSHHPEQHLVDLYNDPNWQMEVVDIDKIQFKCIVCKSERVYKLLPEKTLL